MSKPAGRIRLTLDRGTGERALFPLIQMPRSFPGRLTTLSTDSPFMRKTNTTSAERPASSKRPAKDQQNHNRYDRSLNLNWRDSRCPVPSESLNGGCAGENDCARGLMQITAVTLERNERNRVLAEKRENLYASR